MTFESFPCFPSSPIRYFRIQRFLQPCIQCYDCISSPRLLMSRGSYSPFSGAKAAVTFTGGKILNKEFHRNPTIWCSCNLQLPFHVFVSWPSRFTFELSRVILEPRYTKGVVAKVAWSNVWLCDNTFKIYVQNYAHGIFGHDYLICLTARILTPSYDFEQE